MLGHAYEGLRRYIEAEQLYTRTVTILERTRGPSHPDVGATLNSLAGLYGNQGRFDEAQALYERCIAIGEKAFGPQHPNVAAALNNLGGLYQTEGVIPRRRSITNVRSQLLKRGLAATTSIWLSATLP